MKRCGDVSIDVGAIEKAVELRGPGENLSG